MKKYWFFCSGIFVYDLMVFFMESFSPRHSPVIKVNDVLFALVNPNLPGIRKTCLRLP